LSSTEQVRQTQIALEANGVGLATHARVDANAVPACPLCHARANRVAFRDNRCNLRVCANCDLFFVDPYPSVARQHHYVTAQNDQIELLDCARRYEGERLYYDRHFASIANECSGARSLLDVGCGTGRLLELFSHVPRLYCAGIELNPDAAAFAERVAGCEIFRVPLEDFRCDRRFDAITMINVFSHIPSFDQMFQSLRSLLSPAGKLILRTTEMSRNVSRWNQVHWGIPDDLQFMGLRTLEFICENYKFSVVQHQRVPFEDELFRASRWKQMGRNSLQNGVKRAVVRVPGALRILRNVYSGCVGPRLFVSFIVLTRAAAPAGEVEP